jgi:hypothetical protein
MKLQRGAEELAEWADVNRFGGWAGGWGGGAVRTTALPSSSGYDSGVPPSMAQQVSHSVMPATTVELHDADALVPVEHIACHGAREGGRMCQHGWRPSTMWCGPCGRGRGPDFCLPHESHMPASNTPAPPLPRSAPSAPALPLSPSVLAPSSPSEHVMGSVGGGVWGWGGLASRSHKRQRSHPSQPLLPILIPHQPSATRAKRAQGMCTHTHPLWAPGSSLAPPCVGW